MKKIVIIGLFITISYKGFNQNTCCNKIGSNETFAMLTHNQKFVSAHLDPKPFILENKKGEDISLKTSDGKDAHVYEVKAEKPSKLYLLVIHEWWGLNDYIRRESEKLGQSIENTNVIAIDLYDSKVATVKDSASKYMQSVKSERSQNIINAVLSYIGKDAKVATIGWCFGGGWSLQATLLAGKQSKACVMYYGMPEENTDKLKTLNAPVLFIRAEQDQWINKEVVSKFETNMKAAKKSLTVKSYDADHAFANPSNPVYSAAFAEDAFNRSVDFIKANLK